MIVYFDTSAFLKLVLSESGSEEAQEIWRASEQTVSSVLLYAECRAGLAMANRMGRLPDLQQARGHLDGLWPMVATVAATPELVERAGSLAESLGLRGYDAVHLASAEQMRDGPVVFASADQRQTDAAAKVGLDTALVL